MNWYRQLRMLPKIVLPIGLVLVLALGLLCIQIQSRSSRALRSTAERELAAMAGEYGNSVRLFFEFPLNAAEGLATSLAKAKEDKRPLSRELVTSMLQGLRASAPDFLGAGSAWEPDAFDGQDKEYRPSDARSFSELGSDQNGRFMPYTAANTPVVPLEDLEASDYYALPKKRDRSSITKPYLYNTGGRQVLMTTASAAIHVNGRFAGIVLLDLSIDRVSQLVNGIKVYKSGWAAALSQDATIIAANDPAQINKNFLSTGNVKNERGLRSAMQDGKPFVEVQDNGKGECFYYYYPITFQTTGQSWYLVLCAPLDEVLADATSLSRLTIIISAAALLLALFISYLVVRVSVKPLTILADNAREIASGNLHLEIRDENFGGEIKELSTAFKEMIASLLENISRAETMSENAKAQTAKAEEAMREAEAARRAAENSKREGMHAAAERLEDVVSVLSSASEELSAQIVQSEQGAQAQATSVSQTAAAMDEMTSTVLEVARNAGIASEGSENARLKASEGSKVVSNSIEALARVRNSAEIMNKEVHALGEQAEGIGRIITVINDIADQTNLLALNAAIEAARAGDAGRGFAVVADEVRKLAEKTMNATKEVGDGVTGIQQGTNRSIHSMEDAAKNVEDATILAQESGDSLLGIVAESEQVAAQIQAIATAAEQQSATTEEINKSIGYVNDITSQNAAAMKEAAIAVAELAKQAQVLRSLIEEMKQS